MKTQSILAEVRSVDNFPDVGMDREFRLHAVGRPNRLLPDSISTDLHTGNYRTDGECDPQFGKWVFPAELIRRSTVIPPRRFMHRTWTLFPQGSGRWCSKSCTESSVTSNAVGKCPEFSYRADDRSCRSRRRMILLG